MTPEDFTKYLPQFAYDKLGIKPPLMFRNVTARVFPLRANLDTLQQLCDSYLNIVPPEVGFFRAPFPYVSLVVLDYGLMGESEMRTGWFSQVELYFGLTVEWYKRVQGQWVFHDWAVITPYIFVNDYISVPTGRMVYGFPKILAAVELTQSLWMRDPIAPTTLARISTTVFPRTFTGGNLENRVFLEIDRAAVTNLRVPFDLECPNLPWMIASSLAGTVGGLGRDALWLAQSMRMSPVGPFAGPDILPEMLSRLQPAFAPDGTGFVLNSINLKQFRREDDPTKICYRALTNGRMQTTGFNRAGLLGENNALLGDLTGGYSIRLYEDSMLPIAQTLGLEVHRSWSDQGVQVAEFKPVSPFWLDLNLKYERGTNLAWQNQDGFWKDGAGAPILGAPPNSDFNNTVATEIEAIAGPFQFTGTTIRVIPLLADRNKLQTFLDNYLNEALRGPILRQDGSLEPYVLRFALWARGSQAIDTGAAIVGNCASVFLTASSFKNVISSSNNVGDWAKAELAFMIPVKWQRMSIEKWKEWERLDNENKVVDEGKYWKTIGVGIVPAFTFADNCIAAFSRLEIQGIPADTAQFVRPESAWLSDTNQAHPKQSLLRVNVELLPALGAGQMAAFQPVVEVSTDELGHSFGNSPDTPWQWATVLRQELERKKAAKQQHFEDLKVARSLSLELLGNQTPFSLYTLKQFRDVADPDKACYQALVRVPRVLTEVSDLREIEETLSVRIFGYPSFDIVEELGLKAARLEERAAGIVYCVQNLRPFCIRGTVDELLGECLLSRSGISPWTIRPGAYNTLLSSEADAPKDAPKITVDRMAETQQDQIDPSRTAETMYEARRRREAKQVPAWDDITAEQARHALDLMDPQIVIESILSREWSNFDPQTRWRKGKQKLLEWFGALPQDGVTKPYAESEFYRQINNKLAVPPGSVAGRISLRDLQEDDGYCWLDPAMFREIRTKVIAGELGVLLDQILEQQPWVWEWLYLWLFELKDLMCADLLKMVDDRMRSIIVENLKGEGAKHRWRREMREIILGQRGFTTDRDRMEHDIDMLSPVNILGLQGMQAAYAKVNEGRLEEDQLPIPNAADFVRTAKDLLEAMRNILELHVKGQPSTHNNLDTVVLAKRQRLEEMLKTLDEEIEDEFNKDDTDEERLDKARTHATEAGELVNLARARCLAQFEALVNKLSRAFQKPDFCLQRDAFRVVDRDQLLPMARSWDEYWYYGEDIQLNPHLADEVVTGIPKCNDKK